MRSNTDNRSSLVTEMRQSSWLNRIVGSIVIIAVGGLSVTPTIAVAQQEIKQAIAEAEANETSPEAEMTETVLSVIGELEKVEEKLAAAEAEESDEVVDISEEEAALEDLTEQLAELDKDVMAGFDDVGAMLENKDLPDVIVERHAVAVAKYQSELNAVLDGIQQIRETKDRKQRLSQTSKLGKRLKSMKHKRSQQHFDPSEMPSRSLQPNKANKPKLTAMEFTEAYPMGDYRQLMANANGTLPTGDDAFTNPDWLGESDEVQLTQPIIDKAAELGNDPVNIYHWVRNNIQWNPNWGAKQTAQLTMELGSGNAMDIASLTIGLMRAAGIPARYVHGTIDVPEDKFRNWAGGFEDIESAIDYGASGGIPLGPVTSGGQITKVRMEHIWVEVAVDYIPSRAAVNVEADSWIAIDPSFKQFEYLVGLDAIAISGINSDQLVQDFIDSGTVNETEGWAAGFDTTILESAQNQAREAVENFVANDLNDPSVGDVIGGRRTIEADFPMIGASLPHGVVAYGDEYSSMPSALQQKITIALDTNALGELVEPTTFPWALLNNQKITLAFSPATADDESALLALLPEGEITDNSQLPTIIASYLVNVVPELKVNGTVVMVGSPVGMGKEIDFRFNPDLVTFGQLPNRYSVIAGSYLSVAVISNNVSPKIISEVQDRLVSTQMILESGDVDTMSQLTREDVVGDIMYVGTLGYFAQYSNLSRRVSQNLQSQSYLAAGVGSFGYEPKVNLVFGVPRSTELGGAVANLPLTRGVGVDHTGVGSEPSAKNADINLTLGYLSSTLEHAMPEQLFDLDENGSTSAFSAAKGLQIASAQGQRIYQLDENNASMATLALNLDAETESEIAQALLSGKNVITHTDPVSVPGYTGAGYVIFDPNTGDGAYKIGGGFNGGVIETGNVAYHILAALHINYDSGVGTLSGPFVFAAKALGFVSVIANINQLLDSCGAVAAVAISSALLVFEKFTSALTLGIIVGTAFSAFIFAIAFALIMSVLINFINMVVIEIAQSLCSLAFRIEPNRMNRFRNYA